jgi:hypothetical protein
MGYKNNFLNEFSLIHDSKPIFINLVIHNLLMFRIQIYQTFNSCEFSRCCTQAARGKDGRLVNHLSSGL